MVVIYMLDYVWVKGDMALCVLIGLYSRSAAYVLEIEKTVMNRAQRSSLYRRGF